MKTNNLILIGIIVLIIMGVFAYPMLKFPSSNAIKEDIFEGVITNIELSPVILEGTGVYDRSCIPIAGGLTQCDAGIQTEKGLLNFNYKHNMHMQPCIAKGDKLIVEIAEGGKAVVRR